MKNSFKMQLRSACSILSGIALVALFGAVPAHASIISTTGPVLLVSAPASVVPGASVNTTDGQAFAEQQNVTLSSPLAVDATNPGTYSDGSGPGGTISAGTNVSSYFVLFDSGGASVTYGTVTLTFSTAVLGVIFTDSSLDKSDAVLGLASTKYPTGVASRGQEGGDSTAISSSRLTITLSDTTSFPGDDIRIVTAAASTVPEPSVLALFLCGLVAVTLLGWRGRKRMAA